MRRFYKLIFTALLFVPTIAFSQPNWNVSTTSNFATVRIPSSLILPVSLTDDVYIGAFYNHAGTFRCGGYGEWELGDDLFFNIYESDGSDNGFIQGEKIDIIIYSEDLECQHFYNVAFLGGDNLFSVSDTFTVINATPSGLVNISYGVSSICQSEGTKTPNLTIPYLPLGSIGLSYTSESDSLALNGSTGEILPGQSEAGFHSISFESEYCLLFDSLVIEIKEFPMSEITTREVDICSGQTFEVPQIQYSGLLELTPIAGASFNLTASGVYYYQLDYIPTGCSGSTAYNVSESLSSTADIGYVIEPQTCFQKGRVLIEEDPAWSNEIQFYILDTDTTVTNDFLNVPLGIHELSIIDINGCSKLISDDLVIEYDHSKCEKPDLVFYPDHQQFSNGKMAFETAGTIKIIGKNGELIKELTGPTEWDGKNANGNNLSSGIYFIIYEDNSIQNLTIVR